MVHLCTYGTSSPHLRAPTPVPATAVSTPQQSPHSIGSACAARPGAGSAGYIKRRCGASVLCNPADRAHHITLCRCVLREHPRTWAMQYIAPLPLICKVQGQKFPYRGRFTPKMPVFTTKNHSLLDRKKLCLSQTS